MSVRIERCVKTLASALLPPLIGSLFSHLADLIESFKEAKGSVKEKNSF